MSSLETQKISIPDLPELPTEGTLLGLLESEILSVRSELLRYADDRQNYEEESSAYKRLSEMETKLELKLSILDKYTANPVLFLQRVQEVRRAYYIFIHFGFSKWDSAFIILVKNFANLEITNLYRHVIDGSHGWGYDLQDGLTLAKSHLDRDSLGEFNTSSFDISPDEFKTLVSDYITRIEKLAESHEGSDIEAEKDVAERIRQQIKDIEKYDIDFLYEVIKGIYQLIQGFAKMFEFDIETERGNSDEDVKYVLALAESKGKKDNYTYMAFLLAVNRYPQLLTQFVGLLGQGLNRKWAHNYHNGLGGASILLEEAAKNSEGL